MPNLSLGPVKGEGYKNYLVRLGDNRDMFDHSLTWNDIAILMNEFLDEEYGESKYRKEYNAIKKGIQMGIEQAGTTDYVQEIEDKTVELQKQKYQFQDQKRELNTKIRQIARFEHMQEEVSRAIQKLEKIKPLEFRPNNREVYSGIKANVLWSDFHAGQDSDNSLNVYNVDVFERRFSKLVEKTIEYCLKHNVSTLIIAQLGDAINGIIHTTSRIESGEDVISQTKRVAERLSEAVAEISKHVNHIKFINLVGNHSRVVANKQDAMIKENFEMLIPWYMESRLKGFSNVEIVNSRDGYYIDNTFNRPSGYIHGDLDHVSSVAKSIPQFLGIIPKYIYMGHIHHDTVKDFGYTTVISNGSLCGSDSYAISKRMYSDAMQKMHIFDESGNIEYTININLQNV